MERELILAGIGGQGIQLMAKVLALAAREAGKDVMLFGVYQGMMRGGSSESTLVIGDAPIDAPPIIPHVWGVLAMHPMSLPALAGKLRPGGVLFANSTLVHTVPRYDVQITRVPATRLAEEAGSIVGAGMIALGAFCAATTLVEPEALADAVRASLPPHRLHLADQNVRFLELGADHARRSLASPPSSPISGP